MLKRLNIDINHNWTLAALILLAFWLANVFWAASNIYQVTTYKPVEVRVVSKHIARISHKNKRGRKNYSYLPVINYSYHVDGTLYTSERVTPLDEDRSEEWARGVLATYEIEETYTGYYNPLLPSDAFLVKHYDASPYCFLLPMTIFTMIIGAAALFTGSPAPVPAPERQADGSFLLNVAPRRRTLPSPAISFGLLWFVPALVTVGPYYLVAFPDYDGWLMLGTLGYVVAGIALLVFFNSDQADRSALGAARVLADKERLIRGEAITLRVELPVLSTIFLKDLSIGLVSFDYDREINRGKRPLPPALYEERIVLLQNHQAHAGESLGGNHTFVLPEDQSFNYWRIEVVAHDRSGVEFTSKVPILVQNAPLSSGRWRIRGEREALL